MTGPWNTVTARAWRWLHEPWMYPVPINSVVITDLAALRGSRIVEATRWEEDEWEMFSEAGPEIPKDQLRVVPIGILLTADASLAPILDLQLGKGLRRVDPESEWRSWG
jgi:hypothetical protein